MRGLPAADFPPQGECDCSATAGSSARAPVLRGGFFRVEVKLDIDPVGVCEKKLPHAKGSGGPYEPVRNGMLNQQVSGGQQSVGAISHMVEDAAARIGHAG